MGSAGSSPGLKRQESEADHSPPSSAEVKNGGDISPPHPPTRLHGAVLNYMSRDIFTFNVMLFNYLRQHWRFVAV
jgi:hypothetical protein